MQLFQILKPYCCLFIELHEHERTVKLGFVFFIKQLGKGTCDYWENCLVTGRNTWLWLQKVKIWRDCLTIFEVTEVSCVKKEIKQQPGIAEVGLPHSLGLGIQVLSQTESWEVETVWGEMLPMKSNRGRSVLSIQTMIEAHVDVKTTDGYLLRLFCVGFTKKRTNQIRKTSYAQHQQVRQIRKKMMEIMTREVQTNDLKEVVNKL